ncbi:MAG: glycosyltransferase [Bacilli bacterium]|nr:glycosyltransferase [Bacilli bacterium]
MLEIIKYANYYFLIYLIIYSTILLFSGIYSTIIMFKKARQDRLNNKINNNEQIPISIIVPAYNEELTIIDTIDVLLEQNYSNYEIIVIDDGSTDSTKELVINKYKLKKYNKVFNYEVKCEKINEYYSSSIKGVKIILISKNNGKYKADANNAGINVSNNPYLVIMDADEILQYDALKVLNDEIIKDDRIIAICGNVRVSNNTVFKKYKPYKTTFSKNLLANLQEVEYSRAFLNSRIFFDKFNANLICSGGYGAFKRDALINVGGYDKKSLGEDMELTVKLHKYYCDNKIPYKIKHVENSICWTQVPDNFKDFKKQRQRWHCGLMQTMYKYKTMLFNPKYKCVGLLSLPFNLFYELLSPVFILIGVIVMILSYLFKIMNIKQFIITMGIYILFGLILSIISYLNRIYLSNDKIEKKDYLIVIFMSLFDLVFLRTSLVIINFIAFFKLTNISKKWVSPKRIANNII